MIKSAVEALRQVGSSFKLEPFGTIIQPIIEEAGQPLFYGEFYLVIFLSVYLQRQSIF